MADAASAWKRFLCWIKWHGRRTVWAGPGYLRCRCHECGSEWIEGIW